MQDEQAVSVLHGPRQQRCKNSEQAVSVLHTLTCLPFVRRTATLGHVTTVQQVSMYRYF